MIIKTWKLDLSLMVTPPALAPPLTTGIPPLRSVTVLLTVRMVSTASHFLLHTAAESSLHHSQMLPIGGSLKTDDGSCLSLKELQQYTSSLGSVGFAWEDLRPHGTDDLGSTDLVVLGDKGTCKKIKKISSFGAHLPLHICK